MGQLEKGRHIVPPMETGVPVASGPSRYFKYILNTSLTLPPRHGRIYLKII